MTTLMARVRDSQAALVRVHGLLALGRPANHPGHPDQKSHGRRGRRSLALKSVRVAGSDKVDSVLADPGSVFGDVGAGSGEAWDGQLARIAQRQGFDGKPQVVSKADLDRAVGQGWVETFRGVTDGAVSAADVNEQLRRGEFRPGKGVYGNGLYVSGREETARQFAGAEDGSQPLPPDAVVRMAIDPAAKIVDYDDLFVEYREWQESRPEVSVRDLMSPGLAKDPDAAYANLVFSNIGRFAAARGYDVIRASGWNDGAIYQPGEARADQYAVLNRTVLMIEEAANVG